MILQKLYLQNFRNYESQSVEFRQGINHIIGNNGQGKTNLLESIYCLGLAKSFRTNKDRDLIRHGNDEFQIYGEFVSDQNVKHKVGISATKSRKSISIDRKRIQRHSELIGRIPVVLFNPEDHKVTSGPPAERRKWLDVILSQSDHQYLTNLQTFKRILRQKNHLLDSIFRGESSKDQLIYWNKIFAEAATKIISRRIQFIDSIRNDVEQNYKTISASEALITLSYEDSTQVNSAIIDDASIVNFLAAVGDKEISNRSAMYGPHRDDLIIALNEKDVRSNASRGEHKSILLALKVVEYNFLKQVTASNPILLLDDIYSELDGKRQSQILAHIAHMGQIFITSTFSPDAITSENDQSFQISDGIIVDRPTE